MGFSSSTTCEASSRVGTRTSALGYASASAARSIVGMPKARVLPGARGRRREDVDAGEAVGQDERLNRERVRDAETLERLDDGRAHAERGE